MHIYHLLADLHESFSSEKLEETIHFLRHDFIRAMYDGECDGISAQMLLNNQHDAFYESLAIHFVKDITNEPMTYFGLWDHLLVYFDRCSIQLFFTAAVQHTKEDDTYHLCKGFWELENERHLEAIKYFYRAAIPFRHYGLALAYKALGNYKQANFHYNASLEIITEYWLTDKVQDPELVNELARSQWHTYLGNAYCAVQLGDYKNASEYYQTAFTFIDLDLLYTLSLGQVGKKGMLFNEVVSNYLLALEKLKNYTVAIEVVKVALNYFPVDAYYNEILQRCQAALNPPSFADQLINRVFQLSCPAYLRPATSQPFIRTIMERMIEAQLKTGWVWGKQLSLFSTEHYNGWHHYVAEVDCFIDFLLIDDTTLTVYAVLGASSVTAADAARQLDQGCKALATELKQQVKGILCVYSDGVKDREGIKVIDTIEVIEIGVSFNTLPSN